MNFDEVCWSIPLNIKPEVTLLGVGTNDELVRRYNYDEHWCLHFYRYEAELWLDGELFPIRPGYAGVVPPGVAQEYRCHGPSLHVVALFRLPLAEPYNKGQRPSFLSIRAMQDLGDQFEAHYETMVQAIMFSQEHPLRSEVMLWDLLWKLTDNTPQAHSDNDPLHPQVRRAAQIIELQLAGPISVAALAREVGLSHDRLTKLFRKTYNTTVVGYIRQQRAQRAQRLLTQSSHSIQSISSMVGLSDVHVLNKTLRRVLDVSPRQLRRMHRERVEVENPPPETNG